MISGLPFRKVCSTSAKKSPLDLKVAEVKNSERENT